MFIQEFRRLKDELLNQYFLRHQQEARKLKEDEVDFFQPFFVWHLLTRVAIPERQIRPSDLFATTSSPRTSSRKTCFGCSVRTTNLTPRTLCASPSGGRLLGVLMARSHFHGTPLLPKGRKSDTQKKTLTTKIGTQENPQNENRQQEKSCSAKSGNRKVENFTPHEGDTRGIYPISLI